MCVNMPVAKTKALRKYTVNIWKKDRVTECFHCDSLRGGRCASLCVFAFVYVHMCFCVLLVPACAYLSLDGCIVNHLCVTNHMQNTSKLHGSTSG